MSSDANTSYSFSGTRLFFQLLRISIGFVIAVLVYGFFLTWGFVSTAEGHETAVMKVFALLLGTMTATFSGGVAFFPAMGLIALAEGMRIRSALMHIGAAGLLAFSIWMLGSGADLEPGFRPGTTVVLAGAFIAGFAYWLIAGRLSGCWILRKTPDGQRPATNV